MLPMATRSLPRQLTWLYLASTAAVLLIGTCVLLGVSWTLVRGADRGAPGELGDTLRRRGTALADVLDRCQDLAQEGIFFAHLACTTAELGFTDDWPTANKFWEKASQLDTSVGLSKLLEDARAAVQKEKELGAIETIKL